MRQEFSLSNHAGHRSRLKERFLKSPSALADYELIELLLFMVQPRCDTKPIAKRLMKRFQDLGAVLYADDAQIQSIEGLGKQSLYCFKLIRELLERSLRQEVSQTTSLNTRKKIIAYSCALMERLTTEQLRLLFLNTKGHLILDVVQQEGTLDGVAIYPREVVKAALDCNAAAVVMVHNHPSGSSEPSEEDKTMTIAVKNALQSVSIKLVDHLVVGKGVVFSFQEAGKL